ncbi:unnamed protein product [Gordionus sp. m RMFG-2023]
MEHEENTLLYHSRILNAFDEGLIPKDELLYLAPEILYHIQNQDRMTERSENIQILNLLSDHTVIKNNIEDSTYDFIDHENNLLLRYLFYDKSCQTKTAESDIYSLGMLIRKILCKPIDLIKSSIFKSICDLIRDMTAFDLSSRLNIDQYLNHPFFMEDKCLLYLINLETQMFDILDNLSKLSLLKSLNQDLSLFPYSTLLSKVVNRLVEICHLNLEILNPLVFEWGFKNLLRCNQMFFNNPHPESKLFEIETLTLSLLKRITESKINYNFLNHDDLILCVDQYFMNSGQEEDRKVIITFVYYMLDQEINEYTYEINDLTRGYFWLKNFAKWIQYFDYELLSEIFIPKLISCICKCTEDINLFKFKLLRSNFQENIQDNSATEWYFNKNLLTVVLDIFCVIITENKMDEFLIEKHIMPCLIMIPSFVGKFSNNVHSKQDDHGDIIEMLALSSLKALNLIKCVLTKRFRNMTISKFSANYLPALMKSGFNSEHVSHMEYDVSNEKRLSNKDKSIDRMRAYLETYFTEMRLLFEICVRDRIYAGVEAHMFNGDHIHNKKMDQTSLMYKIKSKAIEYREEIGTFDRAFEMGNDKCLEPTGDWKAMYTKQIQIFYDQSTKNTIN